MRLLLCIICLRKLNLLSLTPLCISLLPFRSRSHTVKHVAFKEESPADHVPQTLSISPSMKDPLFGSQQIKDMCFAMKSMSGNSSCLGFLLDCRNRRHHFVPLHENYLPSSSSPTTSLRDKLQSNKETPIQKAMTRQESFVVAVKLASSLLQLNNTQWLHDNWSKVDIYFEPTEPNGTSDLKPFLSAAFVSKHAASQPTSTTPKRFNTKLALGSLGIVLLELCFGKPIEEHPRREQFYGPNKQPNAFTDISTAKVWHEDVLGELGDEVSDAIRRCLDCSFAPKPNLDDKEFQEAVFNDVVLPLQDLLKVWEGSRSGV